MKIMKFSQFRRLTYAAVFLISLIFCSVIVIMLIREIEFFKQNAAMNKTYMDSVYHAQEQLARIQESHGNYMMTRSANHCIQMRYDTEKLRSLFEKMIRDELRVRSIPLIGQDEIERPLLRMSTALAVLESDESAVLKTEAMKVMSEDMALTARMLQSRMRYDFSQTGVAASQTGYISETLLPVIILYLIVMTGFLVLASFGTGEVLSYYLRKISEGSKKISRGDFSFRFPSADDSDEIGRVMNDFNDMAFRLEEQSRVIAKKHAELKETTERLRQANLHKDRFLANMSHELRTPLNAVIGFAELLKARAEVVEPERLRRYAGQILDASEHLLSLISDLLEVARIDAGVRAPEWSEFDLRDCIGNTVTMLKPLADRKNLVIRWKNPENGCMIKADRRFVCQILINLLNNALKFTHEGYVELAVTSDETGYAVTVKDTGIGIPEAEQERIFLDFHRVESNLSGNYEGAGLGLTLSRRLIDFHGGTITVESEPGKGSLFTVTLPREPRAADLKNIEQKG